MRRWIGRMLVFAMLASAAAVLQPLIDYRLQLGNQSGWLAEEVDYMVTTTFCALDSHRTDGCRYASLLNSTLRTGPGGRRSTAELFTDCCKQVGMLPPCAPGVGGKTDEVSAKPACARVDAKADQPGARSGPSRQDLLQQARGRKPQP